MVEKTKRTLRVENLISKNEGCRSNCVVIETLNWTLGKN